VHQRWPRQAERGTRETRGGAKWGLASPFDVKGTETGDQGAHWQHVDARRAVGARRSGNWRSWDPTLAVGYGAWSERRIDARALEMDRVGQASLSRCGLKLVSNRAGPH
jgi:hypothetical protein